MSSLESAPDFAYESPPATYIIAAGHFWRLYFFVASAFLAAMLVPFDILLTGFLCGAQLAAAYPRNHERLQIEGTSLDVDETRVRDRENIDPKFMRQWAKLTGRSHSTYRRPSVVYRKRPSYRAEDDDWDHHRFEERHEPTYEQNADLVDADVELIDPSRASNQLANLRSMEMRAEKSRWRYDP